MDLAVLGSSSRRGCYGLHFLHEQRDSGGEVTGLRSHSRYIAKLEQGGRVSSPRAFPTDTTMSLSWKVLQSLPVLTFWKRIWERRAWLLHFPQPLLHPGGPPHLPGSPPGASPLALLSLSPPPPNFIFRQLRVSPHLRS